MRAGSRLLLGSLLALGLSVGSVASAHAPLLRAVATSADRSALALALPGFGLLLRSGAQSPFVYLCDAALGRQASDFVPSLAFLRDGSLLITSIDGVRLLSSSGCPLDLPSSALTNASIILSAVAKGPVESAYAVVAGERAGLWRSDDGGRTWTLRAPLATPERVTGLAIAAGKPDSVYLSVGKTLLYSHDGGATLIAVDQEHERTLLWAEGGEPMRLWALASDAQSVGKRGLSLLRADDPAGPWTAQARVNYFGGFVVDDRGELWLGDEGGGLYHSRDRGDTFQDVSPERAVACLASSQDALWACTPGLMDEPALVQLSPGDPASARGVVAFTDVVQLSSCGTTLDVSRVCAGAWVEWQRDVLLRDLQTDAGLATADAGPAATLDDGGLHDAGLLDAQSAPATPALREHSGCSLGTGRALDPPALWLALSALGASRLRRRKRA